MLCELQCSSGYLARMWPSYVIRDMLVADLMRRHSDYAMPLTAQAKAKLEPETATHFATHVQEPMLDAVLASFDKHSTRWLRFPLLFAMGADTAHRHLFWRAYLRVRAIPVQITTFTEGAPPTVSDEQGPAKYDQLLQLALTLKCPKKLPRTGNTPATSRHIFLGT
eukprot:scpid80655/ scgid10973/ 